MVHQRVEEPLDRFDKRLIVRLRSSGIGGAVDCRQCNEDAVARDGDPQLPLDVARIEIGGDPNDWDVRKMWILHLLPAKVPTCHHRHLHIE